MTFELILLIFGAIIVVPVMALFIQIAASWLPGRRVPLKAARPSFAVVVPAHNEEAAIGRTLGAIVPQLVPGDRLVVVADNCTDGTAAVARVAGAEVTERFNDTRRGKGYALAHGIQHLERTGSPEIAVFIDADCHVMPGCLHTLARVTAEAQAPVQAAYLLTPPRTASRTASFVAFAWTVKDFVRPLGWHRLGMPCQLAGSGMAFPWGLLRGVDLASDHLAEDIKLGLDLAMRGYFPRFCPDAVVTSKVFTGEAPAPSQRARWEHGALHLLVTYVPRLASTLLRHPSWRLAAVTFDMTVPPLALLALLVGGYLLIAVAAAFAGFATAPVALALILVATFFAAILLAWAGYGRDLLPLGQLVFAPLYALVKVPLYFRFLVSRQRSWVRGEREVQS